MNKTILFLSLFVLSANPSFQQAASRGLIAQNNNTDSIGTNYALVVGISSYANIRPLLYADDDAYLFAEYLINEKICEKRNVYRLIDSVATTANFYKELTRIKNKIQPNDRVFIYFAGHGDVETDLESGFLLTYNCESTNYPATAIDISMLEKYVNAFVNKKARVVLITDACRSGNLAGGLNGASATMSSITKGFQNVVKILSCQPTQLSLEKDFPGGGHGVFTYHLVDGLSGMADTDGDSSVSLREIGFYLDKVRTETNKKQIPKVEGDPEKNIANFDKTILLALLEKKNNNTSVAVNLSRKERGGEDSTWINNPYYQAFNENIRKLRFIEPQDKNAFFTIEEAGKNKQPAALIEDMKLELSALLEDEVQKWLNKYLRSELENNTDQILNDLIKVKKGLETIESMIGEKDPRFTEIQAKKIFFDSYYKYKKKDTVLYMKSVEELEKANKLLPNQAWNYNLIGNLNRQLRKYTESEIALKKAIKLAPSWSYPWLNLGSLYYDSKKYIEAEAAYTRAIQVNNNDAYTWNYLGAIYNESKKYSQAELAYKNAIQIDSNYASTWFNLGKLYYDLKKYDKAESAYKKAIQINPNSANSWNGLGVIYYKVNNYTEAETAYMKSIQIDTTNALPWNNLGTLYLDMKNYVEAEIAYKKSIRIDSNKASTWDNLGMLYNVLNKYTEAEIAYKKAIQIDSNFTSSWYNLGLLYYRRNKYKEAEIAYKKSIQIDSSSASQWNDLGLLYYDITKYKEAEMAYKKSIKIDSTSPFTWNNLGQLYYNLQRYAEAEIACKNSIAIDSNSASSWNDLGIIYKSIKNNSEAEIAYKKAIQIDSTFAGYWNNLGQLYYYNLKIPIQAETAYKKAILIDPDYTSALYNLGTLYLDQKKNNEAEIIYNKILQIDSNYFSAWFKLGILYAELKNYPQAEVTYKKALQVKPESSTTYYNLACLYSNWEKPELALEFLELSFKKGYNDFSHIETDSDLDNIRNSDAFKELLKKYSK